jgi:lysophospholipase L1-like esterase
MRRPFTILLLLLVLVVPCFAETFPKTLGPVKLSDGDTFVFLGDSITHQCLYTQYVEDYFYTRYPNRRIRFHNAGVSGDQARDTLIRLDEDIAKFKPKYVTVLIGMNDGHYEPFDDETFGTYKRDMTELLDKIAAIDATAILMTPTMYDLRPALRGDSWLEPERIKETHYNATLAFFGAWVLEQANERGLGFVNMYEPLNRLTREQRKTDPAFTMIGDAVHPGPDGQLVMALAMLNDIGADAVVSSINIVRDGDNWVTEAENGTLSAVSTDKIRFTFTANSLPWVVPEEAALGYSITGAGHRMSREKLRVTGLTPGRYELRIDGGTVGVYDYLELSVGVELQANDKTPQYAQAVQVAELNKVRNEKAIRRLRDYWSGLKGNRADLDAGIEKAVEWYERFKERVPELHERARQFEDEIYEINKPKAHKYEILKAE